MALLTLKEGTGNRQTLTVVSVSLTTSPAHFTTLRPK